MANQQLSLNGDQAGIVLTKDEENFLIEAEQEEQTKPCFDARALRQMGLSAAEVNLLQLFFMKARGVEFNVRRFTNLETMTALVSALKYLPRTDESGRVSLESYKASDNVYKNTGDKGQWSEKFRYEYGNALISSHKERREPALLVVLAKVFEWIEKFQKAHGLYQALPQWLQDGMAGDFGADSWIGSSLYEGTKTREEYRKEQAALQTNREHAEEASIEHQPAPSAPASVVSVSAPQRQLASQATLFSVPGITPRAPPAAGIQEALATEKQKALLKKLMAERSIPLASLAIDSLTKKEASRRIDELFQRNAEDAQEMAA